jgi:hypothetical protein
VGARYLFEIIFGAHILQKGQDGLFELLGKIDAERTVGIVQDAEAGAHMVGVLDQQAIGCQLVNVRIIRFLRGACRLDLDWDHLLSLPDQIIGPASQAKVWIVEGGFDG